MRISIIGAGAVGSLLGGLLRCAGHDVSLLGRQAGETADRGLRIVLASEWLFCEGLRYGTPFADPDVHLVALGRQHLHAFRRTDFARLVPGSAPVVFCNPDPAEPIRLGIPSGRWFSCLTLMNAVKLQDGEVEQTEGKPVIMVDRSSGLERLFGDLARFGFPTIAVPDMLPCLSSFFLWQLLSLPLALCHATLSSFLSAPEGRELALSVLREGIAAMESADRPLVRLPVMDPRDLVSRLEGKPASFDRAQEEPGRSYNSMLQCILRGRPTEAAQLNRKAVEMASAAGLHLTWNWRLLQKAGRMSSVGFYRTPAELLRALS